MPRIVFITSFLTCAAAFADPPTRAGRINDVSGEVSYRPATVDDWVPAEVNRPLTLGDELWAGQNSRAEIHIGATAFRIAPDTNISILNLDDNVAQIRLAQGELEVRVRRLEPGEVVEIDLPNAAVELEHPGSYDVRFTGDQTSVIARQGDLSITVAGQQIGLEDGQAMILSGTDSPQYDIVDAPGIGDFERWAMGRDANEDHPRALQYVPRDMVGYEDLDANGAWEENPDYGEVWYPTDVDTGWEPYQDGHWAFVAPWGWSWVDNAAWGFAPFHYGRWINWGNRWGWVPGRAVGRPIYAPALVGWVGGAGASVAWFPLGPREAFVPAYHVNDYYFRTINAPYARVTTVAAYNAGGATYVNRGYVTAVPHDAFVSARPVRGVMVAHPEGGVVVGHPEAAPTHESVVAHPMAGPVAHPPAAVMQRTVVAVHPVPHSAAQNAAGNPARSPLVRSATTPQNNTLRPARPGLPQPHEAQAPRPVVQQYSTHPNAPAREYNDSDLQRYNRGSQNPEREAPARVQQPGEAERQEPRMNEPERQAPAPERETTPRETPERQAPAEREPVREAPQERAAPHNNNTSSHTQSKSSGGKRR